MHALSCWNHSISFDIVVNVRRVRKFVSCGSLMTEDDNTFTLDRYQSGHPGNGDCNSTTHDRGQSAGTGRKCILGNPTPQAPGK